MIAGFGIIDIIVFAITLIISVGIGVFFAFKGQNSTNEYLLGGRDMPLIPTSLSIMVTFVSGILILGGSSEIYMKGTQMFWYLPGVLVGVALAIFIFLPIFYRLKMTSVFEYLYLRFDSKLIRLLGSIFFILKTLLYIGIVLYAPSTALAGDSRHVFSKANNYETRILNYVPYFLNFLTVVVSYYVFKLFPVLIKYEYEIRFATFQMNGYSFWIIFYSLLAIDKHNITGANENMLIALTGISCTVYTMLGGLKAVVWTDAFQAVIMYVGLMAVFIQGLISVGGISEAWNIAWEGGRITTDWTLNPFVYMNFWVVFFGTVFEWLAIYGTNQSSVQRYCSLSTLKRAKWSIVLVLPGIFVMVPLVFSCGLVMYSYYATCDPLMSKQISNRDQLIPYFTIDILGHIKGISGIFVSALFSGTLSTVSSGLNSLAAVTWDDFMRVQLRRRVNIDEKKAIQITKAMVIFYAIIGMAFSYIAKFLGGVFQAVLTLMHVIGGPVAGTFLFGIMFPWGNATGAISGLLGSAGIMMWICIGAQINKPYRASLSRSISGCSNTTLRELSYKLLLATNSTYQPEPVTNPTITGVALVYTLSYKLYSVAAILLVFFIGIPISVITINTMVLSEDTKKLIWPGWWTLFKCLPSSMREKYNLNAPCEIRSDEGDERRHFETVKGSTKV